MDNSQKRMKTRRWFGIPAYFVACYLLSFLLVSQFIGLIGIPMHMNQEVTLHSEETFHHLFGVSSLQNQSGMLYSVNNENSTTSYQMKRLRLAQRATSQAQSTSTSSKMIQSHWICITSGARQSTSLSGLSPSFC